MMNTIQRFTKKLVFIAGNHEFRVERWAVQQGGLGLLLYNLVSPKNLLTKKRKNIKWIEYGQQLARYEITPDLWAIHGWSFAKNVSKVTMETARTVSVVHGHAHRKQNYAVHDPASGRIIKAFSPGCLCEFQPIYMHSSKPTEWTHGFSQINIDGKHWNDYTVDIENGRCILPDGKRIKG